MKKLALALGLASLSLAAQASDLSYSNVGVSYLDGDLANLDADGYALDASIAISDSFFIDGSYSRLEADDINAEADQYSLGLGFHAPITPTADLVIGASWLRADVEACVGPFCASEDGNGWGADAGVRWLITPQFEANIFLGYADVEDEDDTAISVGARYFITPMFSVDGGYSSANDADTDIWNVGLRYHF
ncbi:porin [Seongchinamella sediminis]|uniref:Porin n=1 Tax=Seongchinamella sediminis TaxID=2283635 RepID=A0A3L7DWP4_9GAMM|nr:outer membrane beta-barrel protein [Seongchinamella sediminis]RLQ21020.1 porin [Seongchinamella sediminis]